MDKSLLVGAIVGAGVVLSLSAVAGYRAFQGPAYADVLQVSPVHKKVMAAEEVCQDTPVTHKAPVKDENRIAGTLIGGLLGGVLGHQVGGGSGNKLATVAGAVGGAYAGNRIQKSMQDKDTSTSIAQRCRTVKKPRDNIVAYDVRYRFDGKEHTIRMEQPPTGQRIPVEHGQLVLNAAAAENLR